MKRKGSQKSKRSSPDSRPRQSPRPPSPPLIELAYCSNLLPMALWHEAGQVLDANEAYLRLVEYTREELLAGDLRWDALLSGVEKNASEGAREERYALRSGRELIVLTARMPLRPASPLALVFALDMAGGKQTGARRRSDLELMQQLSRNALAATVGELSAWIIHEISQPLTAIMADAQASLRLMDRAPPDPGALRRTFEEITTASRRGSQILRRLRALLVAPNLTDDVHINRLIVEMTDLLRSSGQMEGISVQLSLDANIPYIRGDLWQLRQVFLNLILNAVEAMQCVPMCNRRLCIMTAQRSPFAVHATIRHTGPGVATAVGSRIFEPSVTGKTGANGMGLRVARAILTRHGGELWAEQHAESGAEFHLTLPIIAGLD